MSEKELVYTQRILPLFTALQELMDEVHLPYIFAVQVEDGALEYHLSLPPQLPPVLVHHDTMEALLVPEGCQAVACVAYADGRVESAVIPEEPHQYETVAGDGETFDGNTVDFRAQL